MIKEQIISALECNGIYIEDDIDISELDLFSMIDSLQFVSFISELEHELCIDLPEEFLVASRYNSLQEFINEVENLISTQK